MLEEARAREVAKYVRAYKNQGYAMGGLRKLDAIDALQDLPCRGSYLDVSTGRGEMLIEAERLGFGPCMGTEAVLELCRDGRVLNALVHDLPFSDGAFDVVTMFDVIEHLIPGDDMRACHELDRVAAKYVIVAANNHNSNLGKDNLHINRRHYDEWDVLFRDWFAGNVVRLGAKRYRSELWRIEY